MSTFDVQITAGIKLLDEQQPGWREKINMDTLDLSSCSVCILGQIFGDYDDGIERLGLSSSASYDHGFNTVGSMAGLTAAWKEALGKNNTLVEKGDVYTDSGACCVVKVVATQLVNLSDETVTAYVVQSGTLKNGTFVGALPADSNLFVLRKRSFEPGGAYARKHTAFKFEKGQFVTNDTGKVYYVRSGLTAVEVKDNAYSISTREIDTKGLREVTMPNGQKFSERIAV